MMWYLSTVIGSKTVTFGSFPQSLRSPPCHGSSIFPTRLQASRGQVSFAVCVIHGSCWLWHLMKRWFTNLWVWMMPETRPPYIDAELNLGDRVWGEIEKNRKKSCFIALPGKGGHSGLLPLKTVCTYPGGFFEEFYSNSSPQWLSTKESACNAEDTGDTGSIPESGRSPGGGSGNPLQDSCLKNPKNSGLRSRGSQGVRHDWITE